MGVVHSAAVASSPLLRTRGMRQDQKVSSRDAPVRSIEQVHEIRRHPVLCPNSQRKSDHIAGPAENRNLNSFPYGRVTAYLTEIRVFYFSNPTGVTRTLYFTSSCSVPYPSE